MITGIIFSKNRALQLELLLSTLSVNFPDITDINVLFTCDEPYKLSYQILSNEWPNIDFIEEKCFSKDLSSLLSVAKKYTVFFTDDSFIYRNISGTLTSILDCFDNEDDIACFSLRLGTNIKSRFVWFLDTKEKDNKIISIDYKKVYCHDYFGYPLSVDGHIFRTNIIRPLIESVNGSFPNEVEGRLAGEYRNCLPDKMYFFRKSALVTSPVNRVQNVFTNKYGEKYNYSEVYLNDLYLSGYSIDPNFNNINISSCHQEVEFKFIQRKK